MLVVLCQVFLACFYSNLTITNFYGSDTEARFLRGVTLHKVDHSHIILNFASNIK